MTVTDILVWDTTMPLAYHPDRDELVPYIEVHQKLARSIPSWDRETEQ